MLERLERLVDASGIAAVVEAVLPTGVRTRQLLVRTLVVGMLLVRADGRPAHLTRVHAALVALGEDDRRRLGVTVEWRTGAHTLTYRQTEYTFGLVCAALAEEQPDGRPGDGLQEVVDALTEASVPDAYQQASSSYAVDWSDLEAFSRPPVEKGGPCADPEASWGHRRGDGPGQKDELFFGYYFGAATMVRDEQGPVVAELTRRITATSCHVDPVPAFVPVLEHMVESGVGLGDVLSDSGYAHRVPANWALPLRRLGAEIVTALHPHDRGMQGTHEGAICCNGNLYCPATPPALLGIGPLARGASAEVTEAHDRTTAELARYKLGRIGADDADGYHRVMCPAASGKLRCPLRPASMTLDHDRPEILTPPEHPPTCCTQQTVTVPPSVNAKTRQKHDYPSKAHRESYARRSAAERYNSTVKDPATQSVERGWCRLMGLTPLLLFLACTTVVRNMRIVDSFEARQADAARRAAAGLPPKTRRRRRRTIDDLIGTAPANAPP